GDTAHGGIDSADGVSGRLSGSDHRAEYDLLRTGHSLESVWQSKRLTGYRSGKRGSNAWLIHDPIFEFDHRSEDLLGHTAYGGAGDGSERHDITGFSDESRTRRRRADRPHRPLSNRNPGTDDYGFRLLCGTAGTSGCGDWSGWIFF